MAEITYNGYLVKNANDWFAEETQLYLAIDSQWNLDPSTPDGLKIASDSEVWASLDELGLKAYNSKDPNRAEGQELDTLFYLTTGKTRTLGTPSVVTLELTGVNGTVVPSGSRVQSVSTGYQWTIDSDVTLTGGVDMASATNTQNGNLEASENTITQIVDPVSGWQTVNNMSIATPGTNEETDAEVRRRRNQSVSRTGQNQVDTMTSEILSVNDVVDTVVYENDTGVTDSDGLPPHSIAPVVDGGNDEDVAYAIYSDKNPGCALYAAGTPVVFQVTSPVTGNVKDITFSRPIFVDAIVDVTIFNDGSLPSNIGTLVTDAIISYAGGDLSTDPNQFRPVGFFIGDDVFSGQLYTPVNSVVGQYGNSYTQAITVDGGASLPIDFNEKARFTSGNITVNIV